MESKRLLVKRLVARRPIRDIIARGMAEERDSISSRVQLWRSEDITPIRWEIMQVVGVTWYHLLVTEVTRSTQTTGRATRSSISRAKFRYLCIFMQITLRMSTWSSIRTKRESRASKKANGQMSKTQSRESMLLKLLWIRTIGRCAVVSKIRIVPSPLQSALFHSLATTRRYQALCL